MKKEPFSKNEADELRKRAESIYSQKTATEELPQNEADMVRLFHELQVYKIELEMQNEELKKAWYEMESLLSRYTDLYDFAPVGYFTLSSIGVIEQVNLYGANLLGVNRSELVGSRFGLFIVENERTLFNNFLLTVFMNPSKKTCELSFQKKGESAVRWLHIEAAAQKENQLYSLAVTDSTDQKQNEKQLAAYTERLEEMVEERTRELTEAREKIIRQEKLSLLGQFASGVGHELRNPLAVIKNAVYYLNQVQSNPSQKEKEYLGIIETETDTAEKIVTSLLDFARIKSVDPESFSITQLVERTLQRYPGPPLIKIKETFPLDLPLVYADFSQMVQVLGNLVVNAYQAMPEKGTLTISAFYEKNRVIIEVADTGQGIPPENLGKIFEPLFTTKAKGIGLGLVVCKNLIEANQGQIEVFSQPGKGATFSISLPVK